MIFGIIIIFGSLISRVIIMLNILGNSLGSSNVMFVANVLSEGWIRRIINSWFVGEPVEPVWRPRAMESGSASGAMIVASTVVGRVESREPREPEAWTNIDWLAFESRIDGVSFLLEVMECWGMVIVVKMAGLNPVVESRCSGAAEVSESGLISQVIAVATASVAGISEGLPLKFASGAPRRWIRKPQGAKERC